MKRACILLAVMVVHTQAFTQKHLPILDVHVHANHANFAGPTGIKLCPQSNQWPAIHTGPEWMEVFMTMGDTCKTAIISPATDAEVMNKTFDVMRKYNVIGVTSGRLTETWQAKEPQRIIASFLLRGEKNWPPVDSLRLLFKSGKYKVFGEIEAQYYGIAADDPRLEPYWALAEEMDIPVGIHLGPGPYGAPYMDWPKYRAALHSPLQMEAVLKRHSRLRVYLMHAAWPMIDELLALMWTYPQVYVDISGIITDLPRKGFYNYMNRIVESGFCNRILFGSDSMIWPDLMEIAIKTIQEDPLLTEGQKRDILYNNAARFLKLSREDIQRHHR